MRSAGFRQSRFYVIGLMYVAIGIVVSCGGCSTEKPEEERATVQRVGDKIFIVDQTGKRWDVTHAVQKYGFVADQFQFGIGPNAIKPIINPVLVGPGQGGYPSSSSTFIVIGTEIGGDSRAYAISDLNPHEIVDEKFGDQHVAVGW